MLFGDMIELSIRENLQTGYKTTVCPVKMLTFSGGEEHVNFLTYKNVSSYTIKAIIDSSSELIRLIMLKDALKHHKCPCKLELQYFPYARQDRRCANGDAFSLGVFCEMVNSMKFDAVTILDPHSDVTAALLYNHVIITQMDIIVGSPLLSDLAVKTIGVSPDAGANKKLQEVQLYANIPFIRADKTRSPSTGQITGTVVYCEDLTGKEVTIWDDICDGGRTFIELAKELKKMNAEKINLYVTHGIFSKGYEALFESGIDKIYTTGSLDPEIHENVTIIHV